MSPHKAIIDTPTAASVLSDKFSATYEICDGYAGGARPQGFTIRAGDFDPDLTDEQLGDLFYEMAIEDMQQKTDVVNANKDDFIAWVRAQSESAQ